MIIVGDMHLELEIKPKLPENATPERQEQVLDSILRMLREGQVYSGREEARIESSMIAGKTTIYLKVRVPNGRIEIV